MIFRWDAHRLPFADGSDGSVDLIFTDPPYDLKAVPLAGGGTPTEACKLLGRRWAVGDIDPDAVARIRTRLWGSDYVDFPLFSALEEVVG